MHFVVGKSHAFAGNTLKFRDAFLILIAFQPLRSCYIFHEFLNSARIFDSAKLLHHSSVYHKDLFPTGPLLWLHM